MVKYWQSKDITKSRYTDKIKAATNGLMKEYSIDEIKKSIDNYATIVHGAEYYYNHKFPLLDFLKQVNGARKFMDENLPLDNYKKYQQQSMFSSAEKKESTEIEEPDRHRWKSRDHDYFESIFDEIEEEKRQREKMQ